jgi:hypothetical protein
MEEIGVGLVNAQAAEITELTYPDWALEKSWKIHGKVGTNDEGYDIYRLYRYDEEIEVPSNRLVFMKRMLERMGVT